MAVLTEAVVPGLEGTHRWDDTITIGDQNAWPRYKVRRITGLHSRGDFPEEVTEPIVGRIGELARRAFLAGRTVVFEGGVMGRSLAECRLGQGRLQAAFSVTDERDVVSAQHPDYAATVSGQESFLWRARCIGLEMGDEQNHLSKWERPFALSLRQSDPRFYDPTAVFEFAESAAVVVEPGIALPQTAPFSIPAAAPAGSLTASVGGSAPTDPIIEIHGPVTNPRITNQTLGVELRFSAGFAVGTGSFVEVDFAERTVKLEGVTLITAEPSLILSDWWDAGVDGLVPGDNEILFAGDTVADPAKITVRWRNAWW